MVWKFVLLRRGVATGASGGVGPPHHQGCAEDSLAIMQHGLT